MRSRLATPNSVSDPEMLIYRNPPESRPGTNLARNPSTLKLHRRASMLYALLMSALRAVAIWLTECKSHGQFRIMLPYGPCESTPCPKCAKRCPTLFLAEGLTTRTLPVAEKNLTPAAIYHRTFGYSRGGSHDANGPTEQSANLEASSSSTGMGRRYQSHESLAD